MSPWLNYPQIKPSILPDEDICKLETPLVFVKPLDANDARQIFADWIELCTELPAASSLANKSTSEFADFLGAVFQLSPYLYAVSRQHPETVFSCVSYGFQKSVDDVFGKLDTSASTSGSEADLMRNLRVAKKQIALICGLADLGGWWSSARVSQTISKMADTAVQLTTRHLLQQAIDSGKLKSIDVSDPNIGSGYTVVAMGKHGASELNYSSDIDLIVFFDPDAPAIMDPEESIKLFVRMTKSLIRILQERTADGYVFRTDLRLRPDPGSMPLAVPLQVAPELL